MSSPGAQADRNWPLVCAVVLNWNQPRYTLDCLRSLAGVSYPRCRVLVVDNASADTSVAQIRAAFPDVDLLVNPTNLGFAGGNNVGIEWALRHGADYVFLLNNDAVIQPDALTRLVETAEARPEAGIVGPNVHYYDAPDRISELYTYMHWWKGRPFYVGHDEEDRGQYTEVREVDLVSGCALLIRRATVERIGLMATDYFLYFEDADWCLRAQRAGWRCLVVPQAVVWHKVSATVMGDASESRVFGYYYRERSRIVFMRRYAPLVQGLVFWPVSLVGLARALARQARPRAGRLDYFRRYARALLMGYYDGVVGRPARPLAEW